MQNLRLHHSLSRAWFYNLFRTDHYYHHAHCYVNLCFCMLSTVLSSSEWRILFPSTLSKCCLQYCSLHGNGLVARIGFMCSCLAGAVAAISLRMQSCARGRDKSRECEPGGTTACSHEISHAVNLIGAPEIRTATSSSPRNRSRELEVHETLFRAAPRRGWVWDRVNIPFKPLDLVLPLRIHL